MSERLLGAFETHEPAEIRAALAGGVDANAPIRGKAPIDWLIEGYPRSSRFAECVRVMLEGGARLDDALLRALLLDDAEALGAALAESPREIARRFRLGCAYTSLQGATALHVCAEHNCVRCARALLDAGLDIDARSERDRDGVGGQTALFHAVNSNRNHCRPMMELLLDAGAGLDIRVEALAWGLGCEWETILFDVTPLSYAQCGLLPQFHRLEEHVYANIARLHAARGTTGPALRNVPNRYVDASFDLNAARRGQRGEG